MMSQDYDCDHLPDLAAAAIDAADSTWTSRSSPASHSCFRFRPARFRVRRAWRVRNHWVSDDRVAQQGKLDGIDGLAAIYPTQQTWDYLGCTAHELATTWG